MQPPISHIGPYRLLHLLGSGGMGQVFAAVHEHMDRPTALKLLSQDWLDQSPQAKARFLQEARALAQLQHPGIVRVYECGVLDNGTAYLAMEMLSGDTLRAWMNQKNIPVPIELALSIVRQIAEAMIEVHEKFIVHRDLKPENIILSPCEGASLGFQPKILDFGIAKLPALKDNEEGNTQVKTAPHDTLGTSAYMAPEQCMGAAEVSVQADVYALGTILFELLAGRLPFEAEDSYDFVYHHVRTTPPYLHDTVPSVPPDLSTFVASMLAKKPNERPTMRRCHDMLSRPWEAASTECPFPGLQSFSEAQAELFFGRETEIRELLAMLEALRRGDGPRWLQIEGPSGTGKSSLVQAGIVPRLGDSYRVAVLRPSDNPIKSLAEAMLKAYADQGLSSSAEDLERCLRASADALGTTVETYHPKNSTFLLVIEQFEELFTRGSGDLGKIDALLCTALSNPASPLRLLSTLRSDYIHRLEQAPGLAGLLNSKVFRYYLRAMGEEALGQVIVGMAERAGLKLGEGLAARMVRDATGTDSRLPLLAHILRSLWSSRKGPVLTHEHYEEAGGVGGALARQAKELFEELGEEGQERLKWLILDLVQVGRGTADTRRTRTRAQVLVAAGGDAKAEEVLMRLGGMRTSSPGEKNEALRLIVFSGDEKDPAGQRVDLVHETLLEQVPLIRKWIDGERGLLERHADLEAAAQVWEQAGCPVDGLPSGTLLDHYRGRAKERGDRERLMKMAGERARRFLDSARGLERRRGWIRRGVVAMLAVAAVVISVSALMAFWARAEAEKSLQQFIDMTNGIVRDADWELSRILHTREPRENMLEKIDKELLQLPNQEDPRVRDAIIWTKFRLSDFSRQYTTVAKADVFVSDAQGRIELGLKREPLNRDLLEMKALGLSKRGKHWMVRGHFEEARKDFAESVAGLEAIWKDEDPNFRRTLATSLTEQGDAEMELGHPLVASALYDKAIALLKQNATRGKDYDGALLAQTWTARADAALTSDALDDAALYLAHAESEHWPIAAKAPENTLFLSILLKIHISLAALRLKEGQPKEALEIYAWVIAYAKLMHEAEPSRKEYALLLCMALQGAEQAARTLGDSSHAQQSQARRLEVAALLAGEDEQDTRFRRLTQP